MAASNLNLGKASGGVLNIQPADGTTNTNLVLPASGTVVATDVAVTDNAIARYDGTTGKVQNSGVIIDDSNNVGIGTSIYTSNALLNLKGSGLALKNDKNGNSNNWSYITNEATGDTSSIKLASGTGSLILDHNGNVGIGVTPSAWLSSVSSKAIQLGYSTSIASLYAGTFYNNAFLGLTANSYVDALGVSSRYIANSYATQYSQAIGAHYWQTAPSGTAGNAITWTNAMTLGANGNLLVGTSTDNGVDKLQVNGSISDVDISRKVRAEFTTTIGTGQTYIANLEGLVQSNGLSSGIYLVRISMNGNGGPYWASDHTFVTYIPSFWGSTYNACPANVMQSNSWYHHRAASEHIFYTDSNANEVNYGQLSLYCSAAVSYAESGVVTIKKLLNT